MAAHQHFLILLLLAVATSCFSPWQGNPSALPGGQRHLMFEDFFRDQGPFGPSRRNYQSHRFDYKESPKYHDNFYPSYYAPNENTWWNKRPRNPVDSDMYNQPEPWSKTPRDPADKSMYYLPDTSYRPGDCGRGSNQGDKGSFSRFGDHKIVDNNEDEDLKIDPRKDEAKNTKTDIL